MKITLLNTKGQKCDSLSPYFMFATQYVVTLKNGDSFLSKANVLNDCVFGSHRNKVASIRAVANL